MRECTYIPRIISWNFALSNSPVLVRCLPENLKRQCPSISAIKGTLQNSYLAIFGDDVKVVAREVDMRAHILHAPLELGEVEAYMHTTAHTHTHTHTNAHTHTYTHEHREHTRTHTHTHGHTHTNTRTHTPLLSHKHASMHAHTRAHTHANAHTHTHTQTHLHLLTHALKHARAYTHTHTHTHTPPLSSSSSLQ